MLIEFTESGTEKKKVTGQPPAKRKRKNKTIIRKENCQGDPSLPEWD